MPRSSDFHVKSDDYPLVSLTDELIIVHRNQVVPGAVVFIGAHQDSEIEIRSDTNRETVEIAAGPAVGGAALTIPAGGKGRIDLPGTGNPTHGVTKISLLKGSIFVSIVSFSEYDTYFKQIDVPAI